MAEPTAPGTFIPHDTAQTAPMARARQSGLNDLILLSAIVLFVASGALAAGVFLYNQFLQTQTVSKVQQLKRAESAFEPSLVQQITRLDDRMRAADAILATHVAPTAFFQALQQATLQTVSFQTLDFEATSPSLITIKMQGVAQSVNSIALQADLFSKNGVITSPIFSNIARQADGVHFDLSAIVNPSAINYASVQGTLLQSNSAPTSQPTGVLPGTPATQSPSQGQQAPAGTTPFDGQSAPSGTGTSGSSGGTTGTQN